MLTAKVGQRWQHHASGAIVEVTRLQPPGCFVRNVAKGNVFWVSIKGLSARYSFLYEIPEEETHD